jgi:hypothetical protein
MNKEFDVMRRIMCKYKDILEMTTLKLAKPVLTKDASGNRDDNLTNNYEGL